MRSAILPIVGALALAALATPIMAQEIPVVPVDANHVRIGDLTYDIRTGSSGDGIVLRGPSPAAQELVQELIAAGCLRPDEANLLFRSNQMIQSVRTRPRQAALIERAGGESFV